MVTGTPVRSIIPTVQRIFAVHFSLFNSDRIIPIVEIDNEGPTVYFHAPAHTHRSTEVFSASGFKLLRSRRTDLRGPG